MRVRVSILSFVLGAVLSALLFTGQVIRAQDKAAPEAAGGYKIAVVDRAKVLTEYSKQKDETAKLKAEYDKLQGPVDAMTKEIEADKKKYDDTKAKMKPEERKDFEDKVQEKYRIYQAELAKGQSKMDTMRQRSMEVLVKDYWDAVKEVGKTGNYHIVLESDPTNPGHTVLYASDTVDITSRVITYLNGHAPAAAAGTAPAKPKAESAPAKKAKKAGN